MIFFNLSITFVCFLLAYLAHICHFKFSFKEFTKDILKMLKIYINFSQRSITAF